MTSVWTSARLHSAVKAERKVIAQQRDRLAARLAKFEQDLQQARDEIAALDARAVIMDELLADPPENTLAGPVGGVVLHGARIREVAIRLLYQERGCGIVVHYKQWFALLRDNGYVVLGKRPVATFLTTISRTPFIIREPEPGTYSIDGEAEGRVRQELVEAQAEFSDVCVVIARDGSSDADREDRTRLMARVRMLERQAAEAERIFAPPDRDQAAPTTTAPASP